MTQRKLLGLFAMGGLAAIISCDSASSPSKSGLADTGSGLSDCPLGTFRPGGITDCVFPAADINGNTLGVADNRCAQGDPAIPPACVSDSGQRAYLWATDTCAPGYRFEPGACNRNGGVAGSGFSTGTAGSTIVGGMAGFFEGTGTAGDIGVAGSFSFEGAAGATGAAGDLGIGGVGGAGGTTEVATDGGIGPTGAGGT
jgi:hypothetical protein